MFNNKVTIQNIRFIDSDKGTKAQIANSKTSRALLYVELKENAKAGNHYHKTKEEILFIISGKLTATFKDMLSQEIKEKTLKKGDLITIKPGIAHSLHALQNSKILDISNTDKNSQDKFKEELIS